MNYKILVVLGDNGAEYIARSFFDEYEKFKSEKCNTCRASFYRRLHRGKLPVLLNGSKAQLDWAEILRAEALETHGSKILGKVKQIRDSLWWIKNKSRLKTVKFWLNTS